VALESKADSLQHGLEWSPEMFGVTEEDLDRVKRLKVGLVNGYHRTGKLYCNEKDKLSLHHLVIKAHSSVLLLISGALDIIKTRPNLLLTPNLEIDWETVTKLFPLWAIREGNNIVFNNDHVHGIVPKTVRGVLLHPSLGEDEVVFIG
jgi:hypothetical protein